MLEFGDELAYNNFYELKDNLRKLARAEGRELRRAILSSSRPRTRCNTGMTSLTIICSVSSGSLR